METSSPVRYLKCNKSGLHEEENLNLVCLEKSCLENSVCCCLCVESEHKKHKTKPLKMVIDEVKSSSASFKHNKINIDIMLDIIKEHQQSAFELFHKYKREIVTNLENIEQALQGYYNYTLDQIILKNSDSNLLIEEALQRALHPKTTEDLKITIKKLVAVLSETNSKDKELSEEELKQSLHDSSESIRRSIQSSMEEVNNRLFKYQSSIASLINSTNVWQASFKFSSVFKHPDIQLISAQRIKSKNIAGYKFALLEPSVGKVSHKSFSFDIKELTSNWLALGFCHRKIVQSKKYSFVFGSLGHGAYMISSNGGSWSHSKSQYNNTLKAIKFGKGDVVHLTLNQQSCKIIFSKNNSPQKYELTYQPIEEDQLHPCILFYYINDEVQYVGNTKKQLL